jgi:NADH-quinone oxidoreductase subunit K
VPAIPPPNRPAINPAQPSLRSIIFVQPSTVPVEYFVVLSAVLFIMGVIGVLVRRNAIMIFMSVELMLNAANLTLVAFARQWQNLNGQMIVFFVITIAAAEVAVGLALIVAIFRTKKSVDIDELNSMQG